MTKVVIVGAGVIGLFCALRLAQRGAQVTLLESESDNLSVVSPTASAAAAGMLAPIAEGPFVYDQLALASYDLWRTLGKGALWEDGLRFDGGVIVSQSAQDASALLQRVGALGRNAAPLTSRGQMRAKIGAEAKLQHAVFVEDEGVADPLRLLSGLAMDARRHGVLMMFGTDAESVTATSVTAHSGAVHEADHVLVAPGAWANDRLLEAVPALRRVRPAKGHLVALDWPQHAPLNVNLHGPGFYIARRREDVVLGATMEFDNFTRHVDQSKVAQLLAAAEAVLPGEIKPAGNAWAGVRPMSPDGAPMIGRSNGVLVAAGHSRNGWLMAPLTAEIVMAHVFGEELPPAWASFSPDRFET